MSADLPSELSVLWIVYLPPRAVLVCRVGPALVKIISTRIDNIRMSLAVKTADNNLHVESV